MSAVACELDWHVPLPTVPHLRVHEEGLNGRVLVIGDPHGCFEELQDILAKADFDASNDTLIIVGDLVNKGPKSVEVVRFARENNALCVRGNHDDTALSHALGTSTSEKKSSYEYVNDFSREDLDWLTQLPYTITIPSLHAIIVHAGLVPNTPLELQTRLDMVTMRNLIELSPGPSCETPDSSAVCAKQWVGTSKAKEGEAWAKVWSDENFLTAEDGAPYHVYFGHDAKRGLQRWPHATGLDTGCVYGRQLSAVLLPSNELVQVEARQVYVQPDADTPSCAVL